MIKRGASWPRMSHGCPSSPMICNGCDTSTLPNPQDDRLPWLNVLRNHPRYWKTLVRRATIHARLQSRNRFHVISAHQRLQPSLSSAGVTFDSGAVEEDGPATFGCMCCGMAFRSKAGEKAHMRGRHGQLDKVRYQRDSSTLDQESRDISTTYPCAGISWRADEPSSLRPRASGPSQ